MAEDKGPDNALASQGKLTRAEREENILSFWKDNKIFEKTLEKKSPEGEFIFYEGPPTANGKPGIHHVESRAFKDAIPRYKTMRGFSVPRKAGWDTHGLPVELQVEKELGLKSKREIEEYGIAAFNKKCKESVGSYIDLWSKFTDRIGYWVNLDDAYYTYENSYIETVWGIISKVNDRKLLYKDYKVVPWCPRCGTGLSSHELAQGYETVKDLSVYVKFKIKDFPNAYFLAWTTTPWTLPGNVALAVGEDIDYVDVKINPPAGEGEEILVLAKNRLSQIKEEYEIVAEHKGSEMVGMAYEPLFPALKSYMEKEAEEKEEFSTYKNGWKVYAADFVTTEDGTGLVHTAVMYGQEDFELGTKYKLPKLHTVDQFGKFIPGLSPEFLNDRYVKEKDEKGKPTLDVEIIDYLKGKNLFYSQENYKHEYPHCWRCKTPLIYYARDSWYIRMSELRDELVSENQKINWEPEYIKDGRFGDWLKEVKDWAISRERYWGTPLPIWQRVTDNPQPTTDNKYIVADSIDTLKKYAKKSGNSYFVMRHGGTHGNIKDVVSFKDEAEDHLTDEGKNQAFESAKDLEGKKIDLIIASPFARTKETAEIVRVQLGLPETAVVFDPRLAEVNPGEFDNKPWIDYHSHVENMGKDWFTGKISGGESLQDVGRRVGESLYELERTYKNKNILIVTHGGPAWLFYVSAGLFLPEGRKYRKADTYVFIDDFKRFGNAEVRELPFIPLPHDENFKIDLHKPFIDEIVLEKDGENYVRTKEVIDVWFDSGAMPFAGNPENVKFPADYISEAIDQTRGWFYTLHAIGVLTGKGRAYKNVICLGHILDGDGKKMSKSIGNVIDPWEMINKYGIDVVRYWMYSVNQPGESKNFDERTVDEVQKKVFNLLDNVYSFYELYKIDLQPTTDNLQPKHILDQWVLAKLSTLASEMTQEIDEYDLLSPTRALREFMDDLSTWYLRRSRDRLKNNDSEAKQTLHKVLLDVSKLLAPFAPFAAEDLYQKLRVEADLESVHLTDWPLLHQNFEGQASVIEDMKEVRRIVTLGLEARQIANIKIRQPLKKLEVKEMSLKDEYVEILKDELNVKEVIENKEIIEDALLDTELNEELIEEGQVREEIRKIQEMRKEMNLIPKDVLDFTVPSEKVDLFQKYKDLIQKTTNTRY